MIGTRRYYRIGRGFNDQQQPSPWPAKERSMTRWLIPSLLLVLPLFARADDPKKGQPPDREKVLKATPEEFIKMFDKNNDGFLVAEELPPVLARAFSMADRNNDGKLDAKEVEAMLKVLAARVGNNPPKVEPDKVVADILARLDGNKDGKISMDEVKGAPLAEAFERLDKNKDGFLDKDELKPWAERMAAPGPGGPGRPFPPGGPAGPEFDPLDKDADGRLTRDELKGTPLADKFDEIDANKDGKIDRKEFEAFVKKR